MVALMLMGSGQSKAHLPDAILSDDVALYQELPRQKKPIDSPLIDFDSQEMRENEGFSRSMPEKQVLLAGDVREVTEAGKLQHPEDIFHDAQGPMEPFLPQVAGVPDPDDDVFYDMPTPEEQEIRAELAPLKVEAHSIQEGLNEFKQLLKKEVWDDTTVKEVLARYTALDRALDSFPFRHKPVLSRVITQYRDNPTVKPVLAEYSKLLNDTTMSLMPYLRLKMDLENIKETFGEAQSGLRGLPLFSGDYEKLKRYLLWSAHPFPGLQQYVRGQAKKFLDTLPVQQPEQQKPAPVDYKPYRYPTKDEIEKDKKEIESIRSLLNVVKGQVHSNITALYKILQTLPLREENLIQYVKFYTQIMKTFVDLKKKLDGVVVNALDDKELKVAKRSAQKELEEVQDSCVQELKRNGFVEPTVDLSQVLGVFQEAKKALVAHAEQNRQQAHSLALRLFGKNISPFSSYFMIKLKELERWNCPCEPLQNLVRAVATEYMQKIQMIQDSNKVAEYVVRGKRYLSSLVVPWFTSTKKKMVGKLSGLVKGRSNEAIA